MSRVLINRKTGDLFEAHRVTILDDLISAQTPNELWNVFIGKCDGYIVYNPRMAPYAIYFNRESEEFFEDLGEL